MTKANTTIQNGDVGTPAVKVLRRVGYRILSAKKGDIIPLPALHAEAYVVVKGRRVIQVAGNIQREEVSISVFDGVRKRKRNGLVSILLTRENCCSCFSAKKLYVPSSVPQIILFS